MTAAGSGCMAALSAERYLAKNNLIVEYHQVRRSLIESKKKIHIKYNMIRLGEERIEKKIKKELPKFLC